MSLLLGASWISDEVRVESASPAGDPEYEYAQTYGAMLAVEQLVTPEWTLAARTEALRDPQGGRSRVRGAWLASGTLTVQSAPAERLKVRLEHRGDFALDASRSRRVFPTRAGPQTYQLTSTLGVVVSTD